MATFGVGPLELEQTVEFVRECACICLDGGAGKIGPPAADFAGALNSGANMVSPASMAYIRQQGQHKPLQGVGVKRINVLGRHPSLNQTAPTRSMLHH